MALNFNALFGEYPAPAPKFLPLFGEFVPLAAKFSPLFGEYSVTPRLPRPDFTEAGPRAITVTASGGMRLGGGASIVGDPIVPTGGIQHGGGAVISDTYVSLTEWYPLGGVKFTGAAPVSIYWVQQAPTGGVKTTGTATVTTQIANSGAMAATLPKVTAASTGNSAMAATLPKLRGTFGVDGVGGVLPKVTGGFVGTIEAAPVPIVGVTGALAVSLPRLTFQQDSLLGNIGNLPVSLPLLSSAMGGGCDSFDGVLPKTTGYFTGDVSTAAGLDGRVPVVATDFTGIVGIAGNMALALPHATAVIDAALGSVVTVDAILRSITGNFSAVQGSAGNMAAVLPEPTARLSGSAAIQAVLAARLPTLDTTAFTSIRIYEHVLTHVMNTLTAAVTLFQNYEYNSFAKFGDRYLAAGPAGLFIIDQSDKDNGVNIDAAMKSGELDFGSPQQKRMSDFYLAMRTEGDIALKVSTDELGEFDYTLKPYDIATLKQRRDLIGKGMRGRYWQFALSNTDGCDFDFDAYSMLVVDTSRRV